MGGGVAAGCRPNRTWVSVAAKKGTKMAAKWSPARGAVRSEPFPLLRSVVRNGPEPSRARRCWARRSEPLTARTVLRGSLKRERRGERLAKGGPPFWYPRPPPLTQNPTSECPTTRLQGETKHCGVRGDLSVNLPHVS